MPMMYDPERGTYKMKPMKIGDDIHNSDRCPPGKKFNMRLGKCIPLNGFVGPDGVVTVAAGGGSDDNPSPPLHHRKQETKVLMVLLVQSVPKEPRQKLWLAKRP